MVRLTEQRHPKSARAKHAEDSDIRLRCLGKEPLRTRHSLRTPLVYGHLSSLIARSRRCVENWCFPLLDLTSGEVVYVLPGVSDAAVVVQVFVEDGVWILGGVCGGPWLARVAVEAGAVVGEVVVYAELFGQEVVPASGAGFVGLVECCWSCDGREVGSHDSGLPRWVLKDPVELNLVVVSLQILSLHWQETFFLVDST